MFFVVTYDRAIHHRRSIRLSAYDYSTSGGYFVTICAQNRESLFGKGIDDRVRLNPAGRMVHRWWVCLPQKFSSVELGAFAVMPNHLHGILLFQQDRAHTATLSTVVQWFKTMTTNEYIRCVKNEGWPRFEGRVWQRNFYERVIRSEQEMEAIHNYVVANPGNWHEDKNNPARVA